MRNPPRRPSTCVAPRPRVQPARRRLRIESLEDRSVPATYAFANGTLTVTLNQAAEQITLTSAGSQYHIAGTAPADATLAPGVVTVDPDGTDVTVTAAGVNAISVSDASLVDGTSVAFADSGANADKAGVDVNLAGAATLVSFTGKTTMTPPAGNVSITAGDIAFVPGNSALVVGGTGTALTLTDRTTDLTLPATLQVPGALTVRADSSIGQDTPFVSPAVLSAASATFQVTGTTPATISADGHNVVPGVVRFQEVTAGTVTDVTWRNESSAAQLPDLSGLAGLVNYTLSHDNAAVALAPVSVTGKLAVTAFGSLTQAAGAGNGITAAAASFAVKGNSPITLTNADNDVGTVGFSAPHGTQTVSFVDKHGFALDWSDLGRSALSVEAKTGNVSQNLPINQLPAAGPVTVTVAAGARVTLDQANTFGGKVVIQGQASEAYIRNMSPTASLDDYTLPSSMTKLTVHHQIAPAILGNVGPGSALPNLTTLDVGGEGIYQKPGTSIKVATAAFSTLDAPPPTAEIKLTAAGNDFGTVSITHPGAADVAVTDANGLILGPSSLGQGRATIQAGGAVTETGPLSTAGGRLSVGSTGGPITLDNTGNDILGVLDLAATGANAVTVVNDTNLTLGNVTTGTGDLSVTTTAGFPNGAISQAPGSRIQAGGTFTVGGPAPSGVDIRLDNPGNTFAGPVAVPHGANVTLRSAGALTLGDWQAASMILHTGGAITQQPGTAIIQGDAGGNFFADAGSSPVTVDGPNNQFYLFSATTTGNLSVRDVNGLILGDLRLGGGSLAVQVGDALLEQGTILQTGPGAVSITGAGGTQITLNQENELRGPVSVTGAGSVEIHTRNDLPLTAGSLAGATAVTLRAGGTLTLPDAPLNNLQSLDAAASRIQVTKDITVGGPLSLAGDTDLGAGPRVLTGTRVTLSGDVTVGGNLTLGTLNAKVGDGTLDLKGFTLATTPGGSLEVGGASEFSLSRVVGSNGTIDLGANGTLTVDSDGVLQADNSPGAAGTLTVRNAGGVVTLQGGVAVGFGPAADQVVFADANSVDVTAARLLGSGLADGTARTVISVPRGTLTGRFDRSTDANNSPTDFLAGSDIVTPTYSATDLKVKAGGTAAPSGTATLFTSGGDAYTVSSSLGKAAGLVYVQRPENPDRIEVAVRTNSQASTLKIVPVPGSGGDLPQLDALAVNGSGAVTVYAPGVDLLGDATVENALTALTVQDINWQGDAPPAVRAGGATTAATAVNARAVIDASIDVGGILSATVAESFNARFVADTFGTLKAVGYPDKTAYFGVDLVTRAANPTTAIGTVSVAGSLSGTWDVAGPVGTVTAQTTNGWNLGAPLTGLTAGAGVKHPDGLTNVTSLNLGAVQDSAVNATGRVATLTAANWDGSGRQVIRAGSFGTVTVQGDLKAGTLGNFYHTNLVATGSSGLTKSAIDKLVIGGSFGFPSDPSPATPYFPRDQVIVRNGNVGSVTVGRDLDGEIHVWTTPDTTTGKVTSITAGRIGVNHGAEVDPTIPILEARSIGSVSAVGNPTADLRGDVTDTRIVLHGNDGGALKTALGSFVARGNVEFSRITAEAGAVGPVTVGRTIDNSAVTALDPAAGNVGVVKVGDAGLGFGLTVTGRTVAGFNATGAPRADDSPVLRGDAVALNLTAFLDNGGAVAGVGPVSTAGYLSQSALTAPNGFGQITIGREMNQSTVLVNGAGKVAGITAGVVNDTDVVADSVGPVAAVGYAAVPYQTGKVGALNNLRVYARGASALTGVGIGAVSAEGDIVGTRLLAPKGIQSVAAGGTVNDFDAVADFIPNGTTAPATYGRVGSLTATALDNARVRADTIGAVTTGTSARFRNDGSVRASQFVARDGSGTGIASIQTAGYGSEVEVWAPGKVPLVSFGGGLFTYSVIGAGYGPTGSLTTLRLGGLNASTVVSRQVTSASVFGGVTDSFVNVFGNTAGVGLGAFAATGAVNRSVFDVTDGDLTSFTAPRFWNSTVQVGARFAKGNAVDAAVQFNTTLRKLGTLRVTNPSNGTAGSAAFVDGYVAAGNLGAVSITQAATLNPDTEWQGIVHSRTGTAGTVTVAGLPVAVGATIPAAKFKNAAN